MKLLNKKELPQALQHFLNSHSMTQAELARRLDIPPQTVNGWVKGHAVPKYDRLVLLMEMMEDEGTD